MKVIFVLPLYMKVKSDHHSEFSNLSNWKEEAWVSTGLIGKVNPVAAYPCTRSQSRWHIHESHINWDQYDFHVYFTSYHCTGWYELNKLTTLPMCGFTAQLIEHRTQCHGGHGFESRWSPDIFRLLPSNCLNWKIYCDNHSSLSETLVFICIFCTSR